MATTQRQAEAEAEPKETTVEFLASLAAVLVTGLFIITFVLQAFEIPSSSMEDTLLIGDHLFVNREQFAPPTKWMGPLLPYRQIQRGDIIVFLSPAEAGLHLVKRVVGVPGDRIHLRDGNVYRNGEKLAEPYVMHKMPDIPNSFRDDFPSVPASAGYDLAPEWSTQMQTFVDGDDLVVPPGKYFAMGDNRDVSRDSRYWGFVPRENVIGRPMFIYWSFQTPPNQYLQKSFADRFKFLAHTVIRFFDQSRWNRTFRLIR